MLHFNLISMLLYKTSNRHITGLYSHFLELSTETLNMDNDVFLTVHHELTIY